MSASGMVPWETHGRPAKVVHETPDALTAARNFTASHQH